MKAIDDSVDLSNACSKCITRLEIMHLVAITQPVDVVVNLLIRTCEAGISLQNEMTGESCYDAYSGIGGLGPYLAQMLAQMSLATGDMRAWCYYKADVCDAPPAIAINETQYFKPKPAEKTTAPTASSKARKQTSITRHANVRQVKQ